MNPKPTLLSTRPLPNDLIQSAAGKGVEISVLSFIDTHPIKTTEVIEEIEQSLLMNATVVFTSMNAVEAVAEYLDGHQPDWQVYCIGNTTRELVEIFFGDQSIAGTAESAIALADRIIEDGLADEVLFFCGDHRRPELPDMLFAAGILVTEIIVYETVPTPHKLTDQFAGVLFYSPSAVDSFFSANTLPENALAFAIGTTTAAAIQKHCRNKIITSELPGKESLVNKAIEILGRA